MIEQFIRSLVDFSEEDMKKFLSRTTLKEIKKKTVLLKEGDVCKEGVNDTQSSTLTSHYSGKFREDKHRQDFLMLLR